MPFRNNKDPDARNLIKTFSVCRYLLQQSLILPAENEDPDQTARMRSLIWVIVARISDKSVPVRLLHKSTAGRYRPVRVADGPIRPAIDLCRMLAGNCMSFVIILYGHMPHFK